MALFDGQQQRVCVRVVYDGLASAGKTTNLRQLAELFATQRTCELFSPQETDGRTLYFDWLQIAAGMVCGLPLVCQVITVPGQLVLTPRRRHLLSTADVVVYVCDSDEQAASRALEGLATFDEVARERGSPIPLVVQANKQDQPRALSGTALLSALERPSLPVLEAIASDGVGVVDTFVAAVRAVVRSIQAQVDRGDVRIPVRPVETATAALDAISRVDVDPEWAAEMLLEEASNELTLRGEIVSEELTETLAAPPLTEGDGGEGDDEKEPTTWRPQHLGANGPPLPNEHVPTGFVWPAHTGRAALRALTAPSPSGKVVPAEEAALDGHGLAQISVGDSVLVTGRDRRFDTAELARQALVRAARERTQLGTLLAPETVLVVQPAPDGSSWLWTLYPRMPTVAQLLGSRDEQELPRAALLAAFGAAVGAAIKLEVAHDISLDLSPRSFGVQRGAVRYIGDVLPGDMSARDPARAIEGTLVTVANLCDDVEPVALAIESALAARLSAEELARVARSMHWSDLASMPEATRGARSRLEDAFRRARVAA